MGCHGTVKTDIAYEFGLSNPNFISDGQKGLVDMLELLGTSIVLNKMHQPYVIASDRDKDLGKYRTIIINNALFMSREETSRLR